MRLELAEVVAEGLEGLCEAAGADGGGNAGGEDEGDEREGPMETEMNGDDRHEE